MSAPLQADERQQSLELAKKCGAIIRNETAVTSHPRYAVTFHIGVAGDRLTAFARAILALRAPVEDDRKVMEQALEAMEYHVAQTRPIDKTDAAIAALRARLGGQTGSDGAKASACSALGGRCEWPLTCEERGSCAYGVREGGNG